MTDDRNAQLRADREARLTIAELTEKYQISKQRIYAIFKATGGTPERPERVQKLTGRDQRLVLLKSLLGEVGHSKRSLAATLGVTVRTVERYIAMLKEMRA